MNGSIKHDRAGPPRCCNVRFGSKTAVSVALACQLPPAADMTAPEQRMVKRHAERIATCGPRGRDEPR
jgi:hypothetical protein